MASLVVLLVDNEESILELSVSVFVPLVMEFGVWLLLEGEDDSPLTSCCSLESVSLLSVEVLESLLKDEIFELLFESFETLPLDAKRTILITTSTTAKTAAMIISHRLLFSLGVSMVCFSSNEVMQ